MINYIIRRIFYMIPTLIIISMISFAVIQLPPGDYLTTKIAQLQAQDELINVDLIEALREEYGLDQPIYVQYGKWVWNILHGDFGYSWEWQRPVEEVIGERILLTAIISFTAMFMIYLLAIPVGIFSATHKYSVADYLITIVAFVGLALPNFLLALLLLFIGYVVFDVSLVGLFSSEFANAPWSVAKVGDLLKHLWIPVIVVGTTSTAGRLRVMRGNLLDELNKPYVMAARAKGLSEVKLLLKYPVRMALNPLISGLSILLPQMISGATITAVVLGLPTTGPMLLGALRSQDVYLAGAFILLLCTLTVISTLLSDILLAWSDPRIQYE
ncbi:MAG: ABC transporter permease [Fidelibacterota bacterium]|nr:MAG: ABC transporter permease [Candidatus Neomarinimicrobiota bacterium]